MGIEELMLDRATKQGVQEGIEQKNNEVVRNLILDFNFTDEQAAKASQTSVAFVQKVRKELDKGKNVL